ncbi:MAG: cytochrome c [Saprospiraceae bacterium]|nr:MAG: cytochrome c-related protein [Bacteroidetes bacterium OLB9]MCO6464642.1 cytochrome c [Saprospiraceae bacterium]MCZ2339009.1 cytochrome c [Chitinophagales bacterium]
MKRILKYLMYLFIIILIGLTLVLIYVKTMLPSVGEPSDMKVAMTPENIARGQYLANHVSVCIDCHSTRDWTKFAGPPMMGTEGKGGEVFDQSLGFPGKYVANNITPYHLKDWTDGEILRAITTGVSKDGRALFPLMPYHNFGQMDRKDLESIIAYIRTLPPIENKTEVSHSDFPMNFIINTMPQKANLSTMPSKSDMLAYGGYLVNAAGCKNCHTKEEKGKVVGEPFAGGFVFRFPDGSVVHSANITPDKHTGIGSWTKGEFISHFKMYADSTYKPITVQTGDFQTPMPWTMFAGMTEEDLAAIYTYLQSLKPIENSIIKFQPAQK